MPSAEICTDNETQAVATGSQRPKTRFDLFMKLLFNEMPWQQKQRGSALHPGPLTFGFAIGFFTLFAFTLLLVVMKLIVDPG